jgi:hypothetical protein
MDTDRAGLGTPKCMSPGSRAGVRIPERRIWPLKGESMPVTLQENLRGVLYTSFYAALALGAYRREGVTIEFVSASEPARAVPKS